MGERWKEREGNRYKNSAGGNESVEEMYWRRSADRQIDLHTRTHTNHHFHCYSLCVCGCEESSVRPPESHGDSEPKIPDCRFH